MSNDMNKTVREFYKAVEGVKTKKSGGYDTQATVRRIEDGIAWVHIPDGVDETPAKLTISAKEGDVVQVRIVNGRAFLVGNASAPPTDNTEAVKAMGQAGLAATAASIAQQKADEAVADAATAHEAAMIAQDAAEAAQDSADAAQTSADNAQASATTANQAANSALAGLGTVESVLDVVTWFSEHKTATTDTTVQAGKSYYEYDASTGTLTKVDPEGTENPSEEGWYELDEAITNYVSTHLAQTNDGLNVVSSINGWRVLISSGGGNYNAGVYLIDPNGNVAQSTTAAGVAFNTGKPVNIGDSTAYINFDGNGHITVVGADFTIGGANNVSGTLTVKDASGNTIGTWDKDGAYWKTKYGHIDVTTNNTLTIITEQSSYDSAGSLVVENSNLGRRIRISPIDIQAFYDISGTHLPALDIGWGSLGGTIMLTEEVTTATLAQNTINLYAKNYTTQAPWIQLRGQTSATNAFESGNPSIEFSNLDASQNIALIFTDFDTVQAPASLTLAGNQGGEYFIAPVIKATTGFVAGNFGLYIDASGNIQGYGSKTIIRPNIDAWLRINDQSSYTSGVYFGTSNVRTDGSWIQCGAGGTSSCTWISSTELHARHVSGEAHVIAENANGTNKIYLYANSGSGSAGIWMQRADGTSGAVLQRANNTNVITFGNGNGNVLTYGYNYGAAPPIVSNTGSTTRVSHMAGHASYLAVMVYPDTASWTNKTINFSSSDIRLKENIANPDLDALPVVNQIKMHSFDWKDAHKYTHQPLGMVADELEEIDPRFAVGGGYDEDGNMLEKSVDTFYLVGYLVKAVQELSAEIERMKAS